MRLSGLATSIFTASILGAIACADERCVDFIERLQDRGYHDIVVEYVERIRGRPDVSDTVGVLADYYIGKSLVAGAESVADLARRDEQLKRARTHLEKFIQQHPQHDRVADAQMDQAEILVQQGHIALLHAENPNNAPKKSELRQQARRSYDAARKSYAEARDRFKAEWKKFPPSVPEEQKRLRDAKTLTQVHMMQAHLHLGEVEYEFAQTYDQATGDYNNALKRAIAVFEDVRQQFRDRLGGQFARMWQGKCYEELGELREAEGIYKELMDHDDKDTDMQALQRQVKFFQIIVFNKRGDHILAAEWARQWLQENAREGHSETRLGVQFEQARALIQQAEGHAAKPSDRNRLLSQAVDALANVTRYDTMYKQPAIALQLKYRGMIGSAGALVTFDQTLAMADAAKDRNAWSEAVILYGQALKLAKENLDSDALAFLRYKLGFAYFQTKKYYEAAVLGEYVARHETESQYAPSAAHVALEAYARAFNETSNNDQSAGFEETRIIRLANFMTQTWPSRPEADTARMLLGDLHLHFDRLEAAGAAFESVAMGSPECAHSLARAGATFWRLYVDTATKAPEQREPEKMAQALERARMNMARCIAEYRKNLKADAPMPAEMAEVAISLAEASIEAGQPGEAVKLMQEFVPKTQTQNDLRSFELRALVALLRGGIIVKDLRAADQTMKKIEATGKDLAQITRVYLDLGKQLQAEMERLKALGDNAKYVDTRASYVAFLDQMAARREGQTFLTLQWTGEAFFGLGMYEQAGERFSQIVRLTLVDPKFLDQAKSENRSALLQAKLRYVTTLRKQQRYSEAWDQIKPVPAQSNTGKDPMHIDVTTNLDVILERGMVLQEWGAIMPTKLKTAIDHWGFWGQQLEKLTPLPTQYWEVRLHLLRCLLARARKPTDAKEREQRLKQAEQQLLLLTKTSTTLGGPAYKAQFKAVQKDLEKELGHALEPAPQAKVTTKPAGT
jgi:tetratricopeptide (TPR) repeat protein